MTDYLFFKMHDYSGDQISRLRALEHLCKESDGSDLRVGIDSLKTIGGDEAYLCMSGNEMIGFLSWYTSDGTEANLNGMVHPGYRRQGVLNALLRQALSDMRTEGVQNCRFRVPANSEPGLAWIKHIGAGFHSSEFAMLLQAPQLEQIHHPLFKMRPAALGAADLEFMLTCLSQAFGDTENWTWDYFARTLEPERVCYIASDNEEPVGMVRVNHLNADTAVIHDLCVLPARQGQGFGGEMLAAAVRLLLEQKCSAIRLSVVTDNQRALRLYQSVGFEVSSEFHYYVIPMQTVNSYLIG